MDTRGGRPAGGSRGRGRGRVAAEGGGPPPPLTRQTDYLSEGTSCSHWNVPDDTQENNRGGKHTMRRTSRKLLENETTVEHKDEHGAAQPQPKLGDSSRLRGKRRAKSTTKTRRREEVSNIPGRLPQSAAPSRS